MANVPKAITDLPVASAMGDDDLLVVSQNATTSSIKGEIIKGYAQNAVASQVTAAQTAATQAGEAKDDAVTAQGQAETAANTATSAATSAQDSATNAENAKTYIENMNMEGNTLPAGSQVTVTKTQDSQGNLLFVIGVPQGPQGEQGVQGKQGIQGPQGVSVTGATVSESGDLVITLSAGDPINAGSVIGPQGIQGETGPTGASVDHIERTSGTGAPGTTDTYTVYLTNGQTGGTFQVYNGSNGTGSGDFMADGSVSMTGNLQMGGHKITNLAEPTDNTDAASKEYVDDTITVSLVGNYIPMGQKGQANGVASLDGSGKVPNEQLPPMDYVPTSRTVNGHALSADVTLDAEDVGARPSTWTPSAADVGAVPTSRTVNGKALSSNITLTADDVNAASLPTSVTVTLTSSGWTSTTGGYQQTVSVTGVTTDPEQIIWVDVSQSGTDLAADKALAEAWGAGPGQLTPVQQNGSLKFLSVEKPTVNIPVNVVVSG